jgi:hypothetical protein
MDTTLKINIRYIHINKKIKNKWQDYIKWHNKYIK